MLLKPACALVLALSLSMGALAAPRESDIQVDHGGILKGTLELPENAAPVPVVLLVAGSGPTDRNGNQAGMKNNSLQYLADALAKAGIASVRYDKRGVAASRAAGMREADLTFDQYVDDVAAWVRLLKRDSRFSKAVIAGHSEGALFGILAANKGGADAVIVLAGAGERLSTVLRRQLAGKLPAALAQESDRILAGLEQGKLTSEVPPLLAALYRPSVQPYLVSAFKYDPAQEFAKLKMPALIVQGSTDIQVTVDDARRLQQARPGTPLVIVDGMNHVFKKAQGDAQAQMAAYTSPDLPIMDEVVTAIVKFVLGKE